MKNKDRKEKKDRRSFVRSLLPLLPSKIRFALMRSQLKISDQLDSRFAFRIARTQDELSEAYRILHDSYVESGYAQQNESGMRIVKYFALPSTTTLIALFNDNVVGTVSIIRRGSFGLPMESAFDLTEIVQRNEVVAEISSLAIDSKFRIKRGALFLPLLKYFWEYVEAYMRLDSMVITVNPAMTDFYEAFLGFKRLKNAVVSDYSFANGNPGVGLYLNVREAPKIFETVYDHKKPEKNLFRYFSKLKLPHFQLPHRRFYKVTDPVMTPEMLEFFFVKKSSVFAELPVDEKMGLAAQYPDRHYRSVLPFQLLNRKRDSTRFSANIIAESAALRNSKIRVLDVANAGLCVVSDTKLSGIIHLQIQISHERTAEVHGEVRWTDESNQIYGILLKKTDSNWSEFLKYLQQDFEELNSIKRAA